MFKNQKIIAAVFLIIAMLVVGFFVWQPMEKDGAIPADEAFSEDAGINEDCIKKTIENTATAEDAATGVLNEGSSYEIRIGYFECNSVERNHKVWLSMREDSEPIVLNVRGLPNDQFSTEPDTNNPGRWFVKINGQYLMANEQRYYYLNDGTPKLKTAEDERKGVLKADEYLVFSNTTPGAEDSGEFGVVTRKNMAGFVGEL